VIGRDWVEQTRAAMSELPRVMAARFVRDYGLTENDASAMTQNKGTAVYFLGAVGEGGQPKLISNWMMGELSRRLNAEDIGFAYSYVGPVPLAKLINRIADGTISNNAAKQVFDALWTGEGSDVDALIEAKGLKQMSDSSELEKIIDEVLAANSKNVEEFRAGKEKAFNALVGQAMKATKGKANPAQVNELLKKKLG
jgi:aspartyl-tRNA(Asn)/glutamyl-tRNA(Gln) amidotransferase subunit B